MQLPDYVGSLKFIYTPLQDSGTCYNIFWFALRYYTEMAADIDPLIQLIDNDKDKSTDGDYGATKMTKVLYNLGNSHPVNFCLLTIQYYIITCITPSSPTEYWAPATFQ